MGEVNFWNVCNCKNLNVLSVKCNVIFQLDFTLSPWNACYFLVLGLLHGVRGEFADDVSKTAVGPIFTGHERFSKRGRYIHLLHRAKTPKPKNVIFELLLNSESFTVKWQMQFVISLILFTKGLLYMSYILVYFVHCFSFYNARSKRYAAASKYNKAWESRILLQ